MAVNPGLRRSGRIHRGFARRPRDQRDLRARGGEQTGADGAGSHGEGQKVGKVIHLDAFCGLYPLSHTTRLIASVRCQCSNPRMSSSIPAERQSVRKSVREGLRWTS